MPLPIAHGLFGASVAVLIAERGKPAWWIVAGCAFLAANLPDIDKLFPLLGISIPHRTLTHSVLVSGPLLAGCAFVRDRGHRRFCLALAAAFATHALLDWAFTYVGSGVALFWPLEDGRFKLGLFSISEMPMRMNFTRLARALLIEVGMFSPLFVASVYTRR